MIAAASLYLISGALEAVSASIAASGALAGAAAFSLINLVLRRWAAEKRKRCGECVRQPSEGDVPGSGLAIAVGSLLDAVPEALIIGAAAAGGAKALPPIALIGAFALANFAEGLSSAAGMRNAGRSRRYVLLLWTGATLLSAAAAVLGFALFNGGNVGRGWLEAFAAGALIALVVETMARKRSTLSRASPGYWRCWASRRCCSRSQAEPGFTHVAAALPRTSAIEACEGWRERCS